MTALGDDDDSDASVREYFWLQGGLRHFSENTPLDLSPFSCDEDVIGQTDEVMDALIRT